MSVADEKYGDLDFEDLEAAVRQSPKGHWFLEEYARRLRSSETTHILQAIAKLERVVTSQNEAVEGQPAEAALKPKQLRYFRQDEEMFVEAKAAPTVAVVEPAPAPPAETRSAAAESRGARLKIMRVDQPSTVEGNSQLAAAASSPEPESTIADPEAPPPAPPLPERSEPMFGGGRKQRIIITRHAASEQPVIPMLEEAAMQTAD